tara:strand:- start:390 stop:566 length:177 start_codon:yes stop_codon:yes gene_type:complete
MASVQEVVKMAISKVESDLLSEYRSAYDEGIITLNEKINLYEKMREITVRLRKELIKE